MATYRDYVFYSETNLSKCDSLEFIDNIGSNIRNCLNDVNSEKNENMEQNFDVNQQIWIKRNK